MKKFFIPLLAFFGISLAVPAAQQNVQNIDLNTIYASMPTISNNQPPLEPVNKKPSDADFLFHEDEWGQIEFCPKSQLQEIQRTLKEYKAFEKSHRAKFGWSKIYVRTIKPLPVISRTNPLEKLEKILGVRASSAPILTTTSAIMGRVKHGFTLQLGGDIRLYGYVAGQDVPMLGAILGENADNLKLSEAFMKLNSSEGLVLVDWVGQKILVSVNPSGTIGIWEP